MSRPAEPQFVIEWRNRTAPKCCHTCDWYTKEGFCDFHKSEPPENFVNTQNACDSWIEELPF